MPSQHLSADYLEGFFLAAIKTLKDLKTLFADLFSGTSLQGFIFIPLNENPFFNLDNSLSCKQDAFKRSIFRL